MLTTINKFVASVLADIAIVSESLSDGVLSQQETTIIITSIVGTVFVYVVPYFHHKN